MTGVLIKRRPYEETKEEQTSCEDGMRVMHL